MTTGTPNPYIAEGASGETGIGWWIRSTRPSATSRRISRAWNIAIDAVQKCTEDGFADAARKRFARAPDHPVPDCVLDEEDVREEGGEGFFQILTISGMGDERCGQATLTQDLEIFERQEGLAAEARGGVRRDRSGFWEWGYSENIIDTHSAAAYPFIRPVPQPTTSLTRIVFLSPVLDDPGPSTHQPPRPVFHHTRHFGKFAQRQESGSLPCLSRAAVAAGEAEDLGGVGQQQA